MLSSPGIGSGLDVAGIVSQLMALEARPLSQMQLSKEVANVRISAFARLKNDLAAVQSAAADLASADSFDVFEITSSNEAVAGATVGGGAAAAAHTLNVTQLAQGHRLASGPFADVNAAVGTGTLQISVAGNQFEVVIDAASEGLGAIRDAINQAADNTGVSASVINVADGSRLILSADETGAANAIEITVSGDGDGDDADAAGLSALVFQAAATQNLSELDAALDATLMVDGFAVTSASNTVTGVLAGVTLQVQGTGTSTLAISRDNAAITSKLDGLAGAYNALHTSIRELSAGELRGESALFGIENQLRSAFATAVAVDGALQLPLDAGFEFDADGALSFDAAAMNSLLATDFNDVVRFFTDSQAGFGARLDNLLEGYTQTGGVIDGRRDGLSSRIDDIDDRIQRLEYRLTIVEQRLLDQFSALDTLVAGMQSTSSFLTLQLAQLPGASNS